MAAGHGITDLLKLADPARCGDPRSRADRGRRAALAEDRDLATSRDRLHLQARRLGLRRPHLDEPWGQLADWRSAGRPCFLMPGPYAPVAQVDAGLSVLRNLAAALPPDRA